MSSYDKVVKLACKPKAAPPKAKTLSLPQLGQYMIFARLSPKFREPNAIVVFRALPSHHDPQRRNRQRPLLPLLLPGPPPPKRLRRELGGVCHPREPRPMPSTSTPASAPTAISSTTPCACRPSLTAISATPCPSRRTMPNRVTAGIKSDGEQHGGFDVEQNYHGAETTGDAGGEGPIEGDQSDA